MVKPVKKKIFFIDLLLNPNVFNIAISLVLFLINIVNPEMILKAATIKINNRIINITFLSTLRALKNDLLRSRPSINKIILIYFFNFLFYNLSAFKGSSKYISIF